MKPFLHRKMAIPYPLFKKTASFSWIQKTPYLCDLILISLSGLLILGFRAYWQHFFAPLQSRVDIDLSISALPLYTFFSMSRGLIGYLLSLGFSLVWGFWAAKDRIAEKVLIPLLDLLQSIPILGFMPGLILFFVGIETQNNAGLEIAAIIMIFTSQAWNMAFAVYHSIRIIPQEKVECATIYRFSFWQKIRWLELPCTWISLIWNSIMSMAGGWFFLMVNEAFTLGSRDFRLPGLGSYMSVAAAQGNSFAMISAIIAMIGLILFLDSVLWRPLVIWSQKFRMEETTHQEVNTSFFFQVLTHSFLIQQIRKGFSRFLLMLTSFRSRSPSQKQPLSALCLTLLLLGILALTFHLTSILLAFPKAEWLSLGKTALYTLARVFCCLILGTLIALPLGLWIGLSEKRSKTLEPFLQVAASFPATLLFPAMILLFQILTIPLGIGSIILMLMGTQWYILFNVLAGTKAIPADFKEVMVSFRFKKIQRLTQLYLPAIFPFLITGLVSAAGGAWNASIVAEYVSYQNQILTVPGLGSTIHLAADQGNIPLLVASILMMAVVVVTLNYQVWLRLYHYSERKFSLNT